MKQNISIIGVLVLCFLNMQNARGVDCTNQPVPPCDGGDCDQKTKYAGYSTYCGEKQGNFNSNEEKGPCINGNRLVKYTETYEEKQNAKYQYERTCETSYSGCLECWDTSTKYYFIVKLVTIYQSATIKTYYESCNSSGV